MKSIFYKEGIKLRRALAAAFAVNAAVLLYSYFRVRVGFIMREPAFLWLDIIEKNAFFFDRISVPLTASAFILGFLQFYPESSGRRFRISCHLPQNESLTLLYMLLFGLSSVCFLWLFDMAGVMLSASFFFPQDLWGRIPSVMAYSLFFSVFLYSAAASVALEPSWGGRVRLALLLCGGAAFFGVSVYRPSPWGALIAFAPALLSFASVFYPASGYRAGGVR